MSKMCKLSNGCSYRKGMCGHEKMMTGIMLVVMVAGLVYWLV